VDENGVTARLSIDFETMPSQENQLACRNLRKLLNHTETVIFSLPAASSAKPATLVSSTVSDREEPAPSSNA
jgi:hypothetical protein